MTKYNVWEALQTKIDQRKNFRKSCMTWIAILVLIITVVLCYNLDSLMRAVVSVF